MQDAASQRGREGDIFTLHCNMRKQWRHLPKRLKRLPWHGTWHGTPFLASNTPSVDWYRYSKRRHRFPPLPKACRLLTSRAPMSFPNQ